MPLPPHPICTTKNVAIPIPLPSAQHMDSSVMHVAAPTIFTALWKQRRWWQTGRQTPHQGDYTLQKSQSKHCRHHSSHSPCRLHSQNPSHSPSHSSAHNASPQQSNQHHCHATPYQYSHNHIAVIPADSIITSTQPEGSLYTESASDGQVTFYTRLQLPTHDGTKQMTKKIDPGAQVNTTPMSKYHALFPNKLNKSRFPKPNALLPIAHTWMSHDGLPKPFLGHFVAEVMHASEPRSYLTHFYMFKDATSPHILLSYATWERLGIITFNVPNLAVTSWVDNVAVSTPLPRWHEEDC